MKRCDARRYSKGDSQKAARKGFYFFIFLFLHGYTGSGGWMASLMHKAQRMYLQTKVIIEARVT